jgi:hypothetical protein
MPPFGQNWRIPCLARGIANFSLRLPPRRGQQGIDIWVTLRRWAAQVQGEINKSHIIRPTWHLFFRLSPELHDKHSGNCHTHRRRPRRFIRDGGAPGHADSGPARPLTQAGWRDGNFVIDGLVFPDRTPSPGLLEYKVPRAAGVQEGQRAGPDRRGPARPDGRRPQPAPHPRHRLPALGVAAGGNQPRDETAPGNEAGVGYPPESGDRPGRVASLRKSQLTILSGVMRSQACRPSWTMPGAVSAAW